MFALHFCIGGQTIWIRLSLSGQPALSAAMADCCQGQIQQLPPGVPMLQCYRILWLQLVAYDFCNKKYGDWLLFIIVYFYYVHHLSSKKNMEILWSNHIAIVKQQLRDMELPPGALHLRALDCCPLQAAEGAQRFDLASNFNRFKSTLTFSDLWKLNFNILQPFQPFHAVLTSKHFNYKVRVRLWKPRRRLDPGRQRAVTSRDFVSTHKTQNPRWSKSLRSKPCKLQTWQLWPLGFGISSSFGFLWCSS